MPGHMAGQVWRQEDDSVFTPRPPFFAARRAHPASSAPVRGLPRVAASGSGLGLRRRTPFTGRGDAVAVAAAHGRTCCPSSTRPSRTSTWPTYRVVPSRYEKLVDLDEDQLAEVGAMVEIDADGEVVYRDRVGRVIEHPDQTTVLVACLDPIPPPQAGPAAARHATAGHPATRPAAHVRHPRRRSS